MTRQRRYQISSRLRAVAEELGAIVVDLDYYGGLSVTSRHGKELAGAAHTARSWAQEIEQEDCPAETGR